MTPEPLDFIPLWGLVLIAIPLLGLAMDSGYRMGEWRRAHQPDEKEQPVVSIVASILGLLALVLGFTFNLAATRFDARRQVVLEEANAIGTTFLRARLLPAPQAAEVEKLLREYVDLRVRTPDKSQISEDIVRSEHVHELLWAQAAAAAEADSGSIMTGLFVQSLNEVIDLHSKRMLVGIRSRIPLVLWMGLFGLTMLGMTALGYQCGLSKTRRSPAMFGLVLSFSVVLFLIADLDRGHEGLLQVSQQALIDVQRTMQESRTN